MANSVVQAAPEVGNRPVAVGHVYVRCPRHWRLGTLSVARDFLRFDLPAAGIDLAVPCADIARARILPSAAADYESSVFEVELHEAASWSANDIATTINSGVEVARGSRRLRPGPTRLWLKTGSMSQAIDWAAAIDDASQAAADAAAGRIWDWFKVPEAPRLIELPGIASAAEPALSTTSSGLLYRARGAAAGTDASLSSSSSAAADEAVAAAAAAVPPPPACLRPQLPLVQHYAGLAATLPASSPSMQDC